MNDQNQAFGVLIQATLGPDIAVDLTRGLYFPELKGVTYRVTAATQTPREKTTNLTPIRLTADTFPTAEAAEAAARSLVTGLCWLAVTDRFTIRFDNTGGNPFALYDAASGPGVYSRGEGRHYWDISPSEWESEIKSILEEPVTVDEALALALELFAASELEASQTARFIAAITSLEALAVQQPLPSEVKDLVGKFSALLGADTFLQKPENVALKNSLTGRLKFLKQESVRQAILRVCRKHLPSNPDAIELIATAYGLRSTMLHEGQRIPNIAEWNGKLTRTLRLLFAAAVGRPLRM